jgi:hypothetical protein
MIAFPAIIVMAVTGAKYIAERLQLSVSAMIPLPLIFYGFLLVTTAPRYSPAQSLIVLLYLAILFALHPRSKAETPDTE